MPALPDTAVCLHCGYALRGLPAHTCPECGRAFDPEDERTWRDSIQTRLLLRMWFALVTPPSRWELGLGGGATALFIFRASHPLCFEPRRVDSVLAFAVLGMTVLSAVYAAKLLARIVLNVVSGLGWLPWRPKHSGDWRWAVLPLYIAVAGLCAARPDWAFRVRFAVGRPGFEWKAQAVCSAARADNRPQTVGLFWFSRVGLTSDGCVKFEFRPCQGIIRDPVGMARLTSGYYYDHLGGDWYCYNW